MRRSCTSMCKYPSKTSLTTKWSKSFWARGYYVSTVGNITEKAIKKYIQEQQEVAKKKR